MNRFVIDIGTNSVRMMKARIDGGRINVIYKTLRTVRTGEGIHSTGRLSEAAMHRTLDALREYVEMTEGAPIDCFATSAVRDAANREDFIRLVKAETGLHVQVLSGEEEARVGFMGAIGKRGTGAVIDIGGGSSEVICGREGLINYKHSFDIGCVRGKDHFTGDFTSDDVKAWAGKVLNDYGVPDLSGQQVYGIGGTATSLAAIALKMEIYDRTKVQGYILGRQDIAELERLLYAMTLEERKALPGLEEKRADIILFGVSILGAIMDAGRANQITVSDMDNLEGFLFEKLLTLS